VSSLQQKLAEANAKNAQLQQENAALRRRLGMAPLVPAPGPVSPVQIPVVLPGAAEDSGLFIELPAVKWGSSNATAKQELLSHIPGAAISLKPFDGTLIVKVVHSSHLSLLKTSKALGDGAATEAGSLAVQNGSLYLQWDAGDQSAALDAIKYASLEVREQPDAEAKVYSMVHPQETSVTLNQPAPVKLALPGNVIVKGKLALLKPSTDWESTTGSDGSLVLQQNGLKVEIKFDRTGGLLARCADPDPEHAQRRLDALNTKYGKVQAHLAELQEKEKVPPAKTAERWSGIVYYPPTVEDRTELMSSIHSDTEELAGMDKAKPRVQAEVDAVSAKNAAIGRLDGTVVLLNLPNGVQAAQITLKAGK